MSGTNDNKTSGGAHQVLIAGEAGQGVVVQGILLAEAAVAAGKWVAQTARYGAAMRGGEATSDVVISDEPIDFPEVEEPDIVIAISQMTYDKYVVGKEHVKFVVSDPFFVKAKDLGSGVRQVSVPATDLAIKTLGSAQPSNIIIVGALAELTGVVSSESVIEAMDKNFSARFREANLKALKLGQELVRAGGKEA